MSDVAPQVAREPTIVVVDDESSIRAVLSCLLQDDGYIVHCAQNGKEALQMVKAVMPALVITDLMMPEMSGLELAYAIQQNSALAHIPIILMTGAYFPASADRQSLFSDVLQKPLSATLLRKKISRWTHFPGEGA